MSFHYKDPITPVMLKKKNPSILEIRTQIFTDKCCDDWNISK